ncbi:MAG: hypothetical protein HDS68_06695 [Bacteroidales bacterium]|nr:hypothetical protein [Bacteroidales bacterium]
MATAMTLAAPVADAKDYWQLDSCSPAINYLPSAAGAHSDHLEMAGKQIATVVRYGIDDRGAFRLEKSFVWPMLRTIPNNTHASLMRRSNLDIVPLIHINGALVREKVDTISFDGKLTVKSTLANGVNLTRSYYPSPDQPVFHEYFTITNNRTTPVSVEIPDVSSLETTPAEKGVDGAYAIQALTSGNGTFTLAPDETATFSVSTQGRPAGGPQIATDAAADLAGRNSFVNGLRESLVLESPDPVLNRMFDFAKIRACESIYATKGGPLHGPGGESYYAAIWANDQAEYANPFFPYTGYGYADESALNAFRHFAKWMNPEWKPIPSSIIAEGLDYWNGAGDRGDAAMIAYGAARYALAKGDRTQAEELWPLIEWCLEYCNRKINADGVVASDSDELEGRFPAGEANLCTSSLYYDALLSAASLAGELGKPKSVVADYRKRAAKLATAMEHYFAGPVEGFDTYAYYKGNDILRSWICIPLTVGLFDRTEPTLEALFSPRLWTENGLLTQAGTETFWDRSTLYAMRGAIYAGAEDRTLPYLQHYSRSRLLGEHVPYAIEAWPEGNQRHLSAESALYARIFTEGLFGIRPTGLRSFTVTPRLPQDWNDMALRHIRAFGSDFDIEVKRAKGDKINIIVTERGKTVADRTLAEGTPMTVKLKS